MGLYSCVCWGWGSRKKDRKFTPNPSPNFPFLQFLLDTLIGCKGVPNSCATWTRVAGCENGRKRLVFTRGEGVGGSYPSL